MFYPKPTRKPKTKRGRRADPVTPFMVHRVTLRDLRTVWEHSGSPLAFDRWRIENSNPCVAPVLDPTQSGRCWGRTTLDHVHDEHGVGKPRATSDEAHLVSLCQGHTEDGRTAGHQWNTANRDKVREYLNSFKEGV